MRRLKKVALSVLIFTLILSSFAYGQQPQEMTRMDFTKEIIKTMNVQVQEGLESPFSDITNKEDIPYILTAFNKKIVEGNGVEFNPESPITKEQAVIMMVRALGVMNIDQDEASQS